MKGTVLHMFTYLVLGFGCIITATSTSVSVVWHDALLVIGGILLGGFCAMFAIIRIEYRKKQEALGGKG